MGRAILVKCMLADQPNFFFLLPGLPLFQGVSCPGFIRQLSGEGVDLVADWGLNTG